MHGQTAPVILLFLLVISALTLAYKVQPAWASGTIYIRADGSIDPPTAPISTVDNITYTLTGNITADADGIVVERSNIIIDGNGYTLQGSGTLNSNGINLTERSNVTIQNMEIKTGFDYSIHLTNSYDNKIVGNKIANASTYGPRIFLEYSSDNSIVGNKITNGGMGIELYPSCSNNIISGNNITNNGYGMALIDSSGNSISGNNITDNNKDGYAILLRTYSYPNSCINNSISGNNITNNGPILLDTSSGNSISGNTITANNGWIWLGSTSNNVISGNNITNNNGYIRLDGWSSNNIISGNTITNSSEAGIWFGSASNNSISGNTITANNYYGIYLGYSSNYNIISGNNIAANNGYGIYLDSSTSYSSYNSIFHNNFINNAQQAYSNESVNVWDDGYPSGGNYWSDYNGTDLYRGPNQNETGSDGIGDTLYFIDSNNTDGYPLMNLWVPLPSASELVPLLDTFVTVMEPSTLGWDAGIGSPFVIYDDGLYKMWYNARERAYPSGGFGRHVIAYAESNDGITWFNNQVVHDAGLGFYVTGSPWVIEEGGTYRMWHADYFEGIAGDWSAYIAHMNSTDGINWPAFMSEPDDQKVLSAQGQTNPQGDGYDIWHACVIHESSGYVMWYTVNDHPQPGVSGPQKIWRATSTDGITWPTENRQLSLPYIPDTWEGNIGHASVVKEDDGTYTMFYGTGSVEYNVTDSSIGLAQSSDGISWVNRTQLLKPSDLGANITSIGDPFHFTDVTGKRYLYFTYYDGESKLGRIQLGPQESYNLTITTTEGGTTDPLPGNYSYWGGTTKASVTATPTLGYLLDHWELDSADAGASNPLSVVMNVSHALNAVFSWVGICNLTITTTTGGTTSPTSGVYSYTNGTSAEITAIPDAGYDLDYWELDGFSTGSQNPTTVMMDSNHTLNAVFKLTYELTITTTTGGTTDPSPGTHTYIEGTTVTATATAYSGNVFDHWELDGSWNYSNPINVTMDANHTLLAVFTYSVTIVAHCNTEGVDVSVSISMDGSPTGYTTPHTFTNLTGTHAFTVTSNDPAGHPFSQWSTGDTSTTISVSSSGTYTAYYYAPPPLPTSGGGGGKIPYLM